jgi:hypothetical protein
MSGVHNSGTAHPSGHICPAGQAMQRPVAPAPPCIPVYSVWDVPEAAVPVTTMLAEERLVAPVAPIAAGVPVAVPTKPPFAFAVIVQSFKGVAPPNEVPRITRVSPLA